MEGDQEQSKTTSKSVFSVTKDLLEPEEKETDKGVDWRWGDDTPNNENAPASQSDNDTASTAECDSDRDGEEEEEEKQSPEWETQPPTDSTPVTAVATASPSPQQNQEVSSTQDEIAATGIPLAQPPDAAKEDTENNRTTPTPSDMAQDDASTTENHNPTDDEPAVTPSDDIETTQDDTAALDSNHGRTESASQPPSPESHHEASVEQVTTPSPTATRRSTRTTKIPKRLVVQETEPTPTNRRGTTSKSKSNPEQEDYPAKQKSLAKKALANQRGEQPEEEDLLRSTDFLFVQANKDSVTVADICRALSAEYDCKLSKENKKRVREHLIDLMKGNVVPEVADPMEEDQASEQGEVDSEMSDQDLDSHNPSDNDDGHDNDEEEKPTRVKRIKSKSKKQPKLKRSKTKKSSKRLPVSSNPDQDVEEENDNEEDQISDQGDALSEQSEFEEDGASDDDEEHGPLKSKRNKRNIKSQSTKQPKPKRPSQQKAAKVARMVEAERLRKKRMEELRIRNEEMQLNQSKEEQERAEAIAAKFETNTDELRLKRLEDRLTLLELLDQKRIAVIDALESKIEATKAEAKADLEDPQEDIVKADDNAKSDEESDSSSDDEELDIVGVCKPLKPLKPIHTHLPSQALNLLKEVQNPKAKKEQVLSKIKQQNILSSPTQVFKSVVASPTKAVGSRNYLRDVLKQKQRKQGNLWLARELGYKTEEDHLRDCKLEAAGKWALVRKKEQVRVEANERKLLRERLLGQEDEAMGGEHDEQAEHDSDEEAPVENEEDEELAMARDLEKAAATKLEEQVPHSGTGSQNGRESEENKDEKEVQQDETATTEHPKLSEEDGQNLSSSSIVEASQDDLRESRHGTIDTSNVTIADDADANPLHDSEGSEGKEEEDEVPKSSEEMESTNEGFPEDDEEGEQEFDDEEPKKDSDRPRNSAWQAMLKKEAEMLKKQKQKRKQGLVEDQAEEEEEEEVAGLEDFGFSIKKKQNDDDDEEIDDKLDEDDLKHVVDDVSDGEGDEEAGEEARKRQERLEEKERHKEIMRRMREGYDGRRGGIAGSGVGARGVHRFDQLVAADNREDAKRLGLLNDDELDSEDEEENKEGKGDDDNEDDEAALLDKMLKDRFLHRANVDLEENFSDDEASDHEMDSKVVEDDSEAEEERAQERLARRFAKRARMQRLEEEFAESQEFSQQRLIDEDENMRQELSQMKNGLVRSRSVSNSTRSSLSSQDARSATIARPPVSTIGTSITTEKKTCSLSIALRASRTTQRRTTFLGGEKSGKTKESGALIHKSVSLSHVVFASANRTAITNGGGNIGEKRQRVAVGLPTSSRFTKLPRTTQ